MLTLETNYGLLTGDSSYETFIPGIREVQASDASRAEDNSAKVEGVTFYPGGMVKTVTLSTGETMELETPAGKITVRDAFTFYENGELASAEPAVAVQVETELGDMMAYCPEECGDSPSGGTLIFGEDGSVVGLSSTLSGILVTNDMGLPTRYEPKETGDASEDSGEGITPLKVRFEAEGILLDSGESEMINRESNDFLIYRYDLVPKAGSCSGSCASCGSSCG